jgi:predicted O-methyltransferase YrrM
MPFAGGGSWRVIEADSTDIDAVNANILEALGLADQFLANEALPAFDLVFIDGNHTREYVQADHEHYGPLGRIVAFHDISPEGYWKEAAAYWREIAYTAKGNLRKGYHEAIVPEAKTGLGWYVAR